MSEPRRRGVECGDGYAFIQWSDEITGGRPFGSFRSRRPVRVTGENIRAQRWYMRRRLERVYPGAASWRRWARDRRVMGEVYAATDVLGPRAADQSGERP